MGRGLRPAEAGAPVPGRGERDAVEARHRQPAGEIAAQDAQAHPERAGVYGATVV